MTIKGMTTAVTFGLIGYVYGQYCAAKEILNNQRWQFNADNPPEYIKFSDDIKSTFHLP